MAVSARTLFAWMLLSLLVVGTFATAEDNDDEKEDGDGDDEPEGSGINCEDGNSTHGHYHDS